MEAFIMKNAVHASLYYTSIATHRVANVSWLICSGMVSESFIEIKLLIKVISNYA